MSPATTLALAVLLTLLLFIVASIAIKRRLNRQSTYMETSVPSRRKDCYEICNEDGKGENCGEVCSFGSPNAKTPASKPILVDPVNEKDLDR
jgi:hypothetical protein